MVSLPIREELSFTPKERKNSRKPKIYTMKKGRKNSRQDLNK